MERWKGRREVKALFFFFYVDSVVRGLRGAATQARGGAGGLLLGFGRYVWGILIDVGISKKLCVGSSGE